MKKDASKEQALRAPDPWRSIGPTNIGGRTISLAVHPKNPRILYAGSASGGLWRLTLTGSGYDSYSWERVETGFPVLGVGAIAINPKNPDILYVGTGEVYGYAGVDGDLFGSFWMRIRGNYGIGLLKSTDGGRTWTQCLGWTQSQSRGVLSLAIDPHRPAIVFAATTEGVYRSMDAGLTWSRVLAVIMAVDVKIDPNNTKSIFVSCGDLESAGTGIYRSLDGGDSWTRLRQGLPDTWTGKAKLDLCPGFPSVVYADVCNEWERVGLYASQDNGDSWQLISAMTGVDLTENQGYFSHFVRINPVNRLKVFVAKVGCQYSVDGGRTFLGTDLDIYDFINDPTKPHVDMHAFANHPHDPDLFFLACDGGVFVTEDGGITFKGLNDGYVTTQFYPGLAVSDADRNLVVGGMQDNGSAAYHGQPDWQLNVTLGDGGPAAIDPADNAIIYASSQRLRIQRSDTGFARTDDWQYATPFLIGDPARQPHGRQESVAFIAPFVLAEHDKLYAATCYVYRSEDGGRTWMATNGDLPLNGLPVVALAVSPSNMDFVYAATAPYNPAGVRPDLFVTKNGGRTWTNVTAHLPGRYIVDIAVSPANPDIAYVALSGYGGSPLYRTRDAGSSWKDVGSGLPAIPTSAVAVDPQDHRIVYVGNDLGVWVSTDFGRSWSVFRMGLPETVMVMDLAISKETRLIRAATHGNGVYERTLLPPQRKDVGPKAALKAGNSLRIEGKDGRS
ncbi:MAG: hypothetical protein JW843_04160 [Candidatus Aminicenantes bacterium]|nr:hypothetical protein [Candidatus Aminicenantes bacterium]